ncbi:MAG: zinc ribbon domain-containing protein [Acidobacteria bacterium]|nr:zinc ribbon domain-containing protein [Acidobacteriota bacterium]
MFCPQCGSNQPDELKFCKQCGTNLSAVKAAVTKPESSGGFDWEKTWLAEAVMTHEEKDRRRGLTAEMKRRREIKAGIITASSGLGIVLVLAVLMEAIVINGHLSPLAADILSRIWIVGLIPILVGLSLIFNGVFISKRSREEGPQSGDRNETQRLDASAENYLPAANTNELIKDQLHSVVDDTTKHLHVKR